MIRVVSFILSVPLVFSLSIFVTAVEASPLNTSQAQHTNKVSSAKKVIGQWSASWGYDYKVIYEMKNGKVFRQEIYDGSKNPVINEMKIVNINGQKAYQDESSKDHGEFFIINSTGDLEYWSPRGNYYTAKKS